MKDLYFVKINGESRLKQPCHIHAAAILLVQYQLYWIMKRLEQDKKLLATTGKKSKVRT